jgi:hypothetical protein
MSQYKINATKRAKERYKGDYPLVGYLRLREENVTLVVEDLRNQGLENNYRIISPPFWKIKGVGHVLYADKQYPKLAGKVEPCDCDECAYWAHHPTFSAGKKLKTAQLYKWVLDNVDYIKKVKLTPFEQSMLEVLLNEGPAEVSKLARRIGGFGKLVTRLKEKVLPKKRIRNGDNQWVLPDGVLTILAEEDPCTGCEHRKKCADELLACNALREYVSFGGWDSERSPSKYIYKLIYEEEYKSEDRHKKVS